MKFIIIPKEVYDSIPVSKIQELGIDNPHTNIEGTEIILHIEHYNTVFEPMRMMAEEEPQYPYPVYDSPSSGFESVLSSPSWSSEINDERS